jgi:isopentenyl-diphosphate delta-isomerase type 1
MEDELFDIVDENDNIIGRATRRQVHKNKKLIHRSVGVAVFDDGGRIFLQKRSKNKDTEPLKWTISCSGHVVSGDTYEVIARRELMEELGMNLEITPIVKFICKAPYETEITMLYKSFSNGPFKLNSQEIIEGKFFTQKELNYEIKSGRIKLSFIGKKSLEKLGWEIP